MLRKLNTSVKEHNTMKMVIKCYLLNMNIIHHIPIIKISSIEKVAKPESTEVPMPDEYYVPTAVIY